MALADEVKNRYGEAWLVEITNPQAGGFSTIDAVRLGNACTDVIAAFTVYSAATFNIANPNHVFVAVDGVIAFLLMRCGTYKEDAKNWMEDFKSRLAKLASIDHRDYVSPELVLEEPRMPRSAGKYVIPLRPNRGATAAANQSGNE